MRVLHIDTGGAMRGGQYQVLLLHDSLANMGLDQVLLAGAAIQARRRVEAASWRSVLRHSRGCDVIHAHDARAHTLAAVCGSGRPVVVTRRVAFPLGKGAASRWKYRRATRFLAISQFVAGVLRRGGVPGGKIGIVYDAVPWVAERERRNAAKRGARERPRPGFRLVSPNLDDPLKCRGLALQASRRAGLPLCLSDDLTRDLRSADAFLYLSESEGLGSAILLAMSFGVPVIASSVGGIPEVVSDGATGLLVENDVESIASAIRHLRADRDLRIRLTENGLKRIRSEFSPERTAKSTADAYHLVIGDRRDWRS